MPRGPVRWRKPDPVAVDRLLAGRPIRRNATASEVLTAVVVLQRRGQSRADAIRSVSDLLAVQRNRSSDGKALWPSRVDLYEREAAKAGWRAEPDYWFAAYCPERAAA